jgi:hypothetical protein
MTNDKHTAIKAKERPDQVPKYKNSTPEHLKIQKRRSSKTHFRGSPSLEARVARLSLEDMAEDGTGNSDAERFARTAALMAMLGDEINDYGSAIHSELQRQIEERKFHDVMNTVTQHLNTLRWSTPPNSPPLTNSSEGTPSSASSETRRNRFIERELRNKEFYFLLENDHQFHSLMRDLTGLREWWSTNCAEWRQRRDEILNIEESLKVMAFQMDQADGPEHSRLQLQFKLQMDEMTSRLDWFPKNERLQKSRLGSRASHTRLRS